MIAVAFALPTESSSFRNLLAARASSSTGVRVIHTGVGQVATERAICAFLSTESPDLVVSSGFAGALTDDLQVGDLLLAENFTSPEWLERCQAVLRVHTRTGALATASAITDTSSARADLARQTGAVAVDMETEFIVRACTEAAVPVISLRVISDTPAAPMPAPPHVLFDVAAQRTNYRALASHVARHPSSAVRLIAFARQIASAREKLANGLIELVRSAL